MSLSIHHGTTPQPLRRLCPDSLKASLPLIYILLWTGINLLFLTSFPFVHTDEPWLSGLSRSMMEAGSPQVTEDFFDLYPRQPHAVKILFHGLQILFIQIFGYSLGTVRLLSLLGGSLSLALFYRLALRILPDKNRKGPALAATIALSLDIQFLYTAHLARQEIFMVLLSLGVFNLLFSQRKPLLRGALSGGVLGLSSGFHPNVFLIAWPAGLFLLSEILRRRRSPQEGVSFLLAAAAGAVPFILLSFLFNPQFLQDYAAYGRPLGVLDTPDIKLLHWPGFYRKLFFQIGGTYETPPLQLTLAAFPIVLIIALFRGRGRLGLLGLIGFNVGLILLGKYSPPSIIILFPFFYLLVAELLDHPVATRIFPLFLAALLIISSWEILHESFRKEESFAEYTETLNRNIPPGSAALGSLYAEYALSDGALYNWRNLPYLQEKGISLKKYIRDRGITYVILPDELDYIYQRRPYWNVLYGNPSFWYPALKRLLKENGTLIESWESPVYAMRIDAYRQLSPWRVRIYKLSTKE